MGCVTDSITAQEAMAKYSVEKVSGPRMGNSACDAFGQQADFTPNLSPILSSKQKLTSSSGYRPAHQENSNMPTTHFI